MTPLSRLVCGITLKSEKDESYYAGERGKFVEKQSCSLTCAVNGSIVPSIIESFEMI